MGFWGGRGNKRASSLAGLLLSVLAAGCTVTQGGDGITGTGACGSSPISISFSLDVFGNVQSILVTVTGPGIDPPITTQIDTKTLQAAFSVPSGENRTFKAEIKTDAGTYTREATVCVPDNQPVNVSMGVVRQNRDPVIDRITPPSGTVTNCSPVSLTVSAYDPDGDPLTYTWSATVGTITGSGSSVTWQPAYVSGGIGAVSVTVQDGRGGSASGSATFSGLGSCG